MLLSLSSRFHETMVQWRVQAGSGHVQVTGAATARPHMLRPRLLRKHVRVWTEVEAHLLITRQ